MEKERLQSAAVPITQQYSSFSSLLRSVLCGCLLFKKNLNASKPSEHPPQVEECLKV